MAQFRYSAKDMAGKVHRGTLEAATEKALQEELTGQGLFLINVKNLTEAKGHKKLKPKQLSEFCRELSTLLASGVSLVRALDIISNQEGIPGSEREIYQAVLLDLRKGISLSEAMEARGCFPELMLGMIRSGEGSGNLVCGRRADGIYTFNAACFACTAVGSVLRGITDSAVRHPSLGAAVFQQPETGEDECGQSDWENSGGYR